MITVDELAEQLKKALGASYFTQSAAYAAARIALDAMAEGGKDLRAIRDEIRLRSEVLLTFQMPTLSLEESAEKNKQNARFLWLLDRERALMGEEWVTNG